MLCEAHSNWVRDRFHSFDEGRVVMDQVVLHVHPSANTRLSQTNGTRLKSPLNRKAKGSDSLQGDWFEIRRQKKWLVFPATHLSFPENECVTSKCKPVQL